MIQSFAYVLDKVGNRTKLTLDGGDFVEYQYDPLYQLTREHRKASGGSTQYYNEFYYNYISNRTKLVYNDGTSSTTSTYSYNASDQLTRDITGATTTDYTYDSSGALTRKSSGGSNFDYLYDARSLITKYDAPGTSNDTTYNWDLLDRRVRKDLNGTVTRFLYDHSIGEIIAEYDGSGTPVLQAGYVPTGLDSNVSMTRSGTLYYLHPDALQSTWNLSRASDEVVQNTYAYQAFGNQYGSPTENVTNTRRFTGAEWNTEDSTQTHGVRRYHPTVGRWNRRDSLGIIDGANIYLFVRNRPVTSTDRTGQSSQLSFPIPNDIYIDFKEGEFKQDLCGHFQTVWDLKWPPHQFTTLFVSELCYHCPIFRCEERGCGCTLVGREKDESNCFYEVLRLQPGEPGVQDQNVNPPLSTPCCSTKGSITVTNNIRVFDWHSVKDYPGFPAWYATVRARAFERCGVAVPTSGGTYQRPPFWDSDPIAYPGMLHAAGFRNWKVKWDCCKNPSTQTFSWLADDSSGTIAKPKRCP